MFLDYETLKVIWWFLVGAVLVIYTVTAGFDFGVTLLLPFMNRKKTFAENDVERRILLNTIAPTWDGNQTWIVFGGGAIFVVWPIVYASTFSGLYALMLFILWSFFFRPPGFDYRGKLHSAAWRKMWDWGLFISAFFPAMAFGIGMANLFLGLPISFDPISMRSFYDGNFLQLLNPFGVLGGLASLFMILMHGTAYLNRRTMGDLQAHIRHLHRTFCVVFLILVTLIGVMLVYHVNGYQLVSQSANPTAHPFDMVIAQSKGGWFASFAQHPWKWIPVVLTYVGVLISLATLKRGRGYMAFAGSAIAIAGTIFTVGCNLFPFVIPSSVNPSQSLTVWNATSSQYTLTGMFYICLIFLVVIFAYKFWGYAHVWRAKHYLEEKDVQENTHTFY